MSQDQEFQLSEYDRQLIADCIDRKPHAWENFVDRFLAQVADTVDHTVAVRGIVVTDPQKDDMISEVFTELYQGEFLLLKSFSGQSEFSTFLAVVTRRLVVRSLVRMPNLTFADPVKDPWIREQQKNELPIALSTDATSDQEKAIDSPTELLSGQESDQPSTVMFTDPKSIHVAESDPQVEVGRQMIEMLAALAPTEQQIVRLYYTEQKTPDQISEELNLPSDQVQSVIELAMNSTRALLNQNQKKAA